LVVEDGRSGSVRMGRPRRPEHARAWLGWGVITCTASRPTVGIRGLMPPPLPSPLPGVVGPGGAGPGRDGHVGRRRTNSTCLRAAATVPMFLPLVAATWAL
jgi:hypothetical protein